LTIYFDESTTPTQSVCRERRVLNRTNKNLHDERKARGAQESWQVVQNIF